MSEIAVDGRRLEVLDLPGDAARPPLLLLHEGLGSVRLWRDFPQALAAATGARVVAFSRFGHGDSDPPPAARTPQFMHEEARAVLPVVLRELDLEDAVLVGHSDGASIALIHAGEQAPRAVVAMAPHVFVEDVSLTAIRAARVAYERDGLRERMARHHRDPDAAFYGWNDVWLHPEFGDWQLLEEVGGITCPLLLLQGEHDQYGTLAQLDAIADRARGPVERVHLDARHAPHLEAPAETLAAVADFVARV